MGARGSALVRLTCWYCAHEWMTRVTKGMARCSSCRTFNHLPEAKRAKGAI